MAHNWADCASLENTPSSNQFPLASCFLHENNGKDATTYPRSICRAEEAEHQRLLDSKATLESVKSCSMLFAFGSLPVHGRGVLLHASHA